jgi:hypothetical protein
MKNFTNVSKTLTKVSMTGSEGEEEGGGGVTMASSLLASAMAFLSSSSLACAKGIVTFFTSSLDWFLVSYF